MSLLTIGALDFLHNRLDKNLFHTYNKIFSSFPSHHHIDTTNLHNISIDVNKAITENFKPDENVLVFILTGPDIGNQGNSLVNYENYKLLYDIEDPKVWKQKLFIDKYNIKYISIRYKCKDMDELQAHYKDKNVKFFHIPLYRDTSVYNNDEPTTKDIDLLFYGSINNEAYPLRTKLYQLMRLMLNEPKITSKYRLKLIRPEDNIAGEELNNYIKRSKYCIGTTRTWDCLLGKYLEIIMGGALLVGAIPSQETELFEGKYIKLDINMDYNQMYDAIAEAIDNYDTNYESFKSLEEKFKKKFDMENVINDFNAVYDTILTE